LSVACLTAHAADDALATTATFAALYAKFNAAMNAKNVAEVGAMLAPDFGGEDIAAKPRSAAKLLDEISALPDDGNRKIDGAIVSLTLDGATAHVVQRLLVTTSKSLLGKKLTFELVATSDDTWIRSGGGWLLSRSMARRMEYLANGSVMSTKTNPPR
jgi:hypothetical protein